MGHPFGQSRLEMASILRLQARRDARAHAATKPRRALSMPCALSRAAFRRTPLAGLGGARGGPHGTNPGTLITRGKPGVASTFELWGDTSGGQDEPWKHLRRRKQWRVMGPRRRRDSESRDTVSRDRRFPQAIEFTGMQRSQVDGAGMGSWR